MGRPPAASLRVDTPTRVLDAAELAFSLAGLAGAKLADIAGAAGIRRPSLLYHFASKERLYAAVVERGFDALGEVLAQAMRSEGRFFARLQLVVSAFVDFVDQRPQLARLVVRQMIESDSPGQRILVERVAPLLDDIEAWISREGAEYLRPGVPVRAAILQICSSILLRAASGEIRSRMWGDVDEDWILVEALFLRTRSMSSSSTHALDEQLAREAGLANENAQSKDDGR